jgi:hypothetical protein
MSELLQSRQHPDADQLSAFVEHALPAHEHEAMLAHLAVCPDCRSVVAVSMPPVEEHPEVQPVPVRRPWFSGWNLVWPLAAAFAALLLIATLVRKSGGNAPPTQIAETRVPAKPAVVGAMAPAQATPLASREAIPSPTGQDRSINALHGAKPAAGKAPAEAKVEDKSVASLPIMGRNVQSLPPSTGAAPPRFMAGMGLGSGSGAATGLQTQVPERGVNLKQQLSGSAGVPAAAPVTAYSMAGPVTAPLAASPAPPSPPPPTAMARAANESAPAAGASLGRAASAVDALSDQALAVEPAPNAGPTLIPPNSPAGFTSSGNVLLHRLPSGLPVLSLATAGETMLALDSGNALFLSGDAGAHWKRVRAKWQGRAVKVALAVAPVVRMQQPLAVNPSATAQYDERKLRISTAAGTEATAQSVAGGGATLTGQVTDSAGAVIPGAAVTATNAATAAVVTVKTDTAGRYFAGGLAPGTYRIDVSAPGFAGQELNVTLAALQKATADLRLQVGQMTETVTVMSAAPQIETENSSDSAEVLNSKPKRGAPPLFAITTDAGERWVSADGRSWKRE